MRLRRLHKVGALVTVRRRIGPEGDILIGSARCQSCEQEGVGVIVRDALDGQFVICADCIARGIQMFKGELKFPGVE